MALAALATKYNPMTAGPIMPYIAIPSMKRLKNQDVSVHQGEAVEVVAKLSEGGQIR